MAWTWPSAPEFGALAGFLPLRMVANHEGLGHQPVPRQIAQHLGLDGGERDGLLAEHMLAGPRRRQGQWHMEVIGQGVIDRLDIGIGQHGLIGAIGPGNAELAGPALGPLLLPRRDRQDLDLPAFQHPGQHLRDPDSGRADHAPPHRLHGRLPSIPGYASLICSRRPFPPHRDRRTVTTRPATSTGWRGASANVTKVTVARPIPLWHPGPAAPCLASRKPPFRPPRRRGLCGPPRDCAAKGDAVKRPPERGQARRCCGRPGWHNFRHANDLDPQQRFGASLSGIRLHASAEAFGYIHL